MTLQRQMQSILSRRRDLHRRKWHSITLVIRKVLMWAMMMGIWAIKVTNRGALIRVSQATSYWTLKLLPWTVVKESDTFVQLLAVESAIKTLMVSNIMQKMDIKYTKKGNIKRRNLINVIVARAIKVPVAYGTTCNHSIRRSPHYHTKYLIVFYLLKITRMYLAGLLERYENSLGTKDLYNLLSAWFLTYMPVI